MGIMMKFKLFLISASCVLFAVNGTLAQPDATVIVHQSTLNGFMNAIGPVSGKDDFNVAGAKGSYTWTVKNAKINLMPDAAKFTADASIKVAGFKYNSKAKGDVAVKYNQEANLISVKVKKASFEVYTKIFGKKIHIADVDISKVYKPEFQFAGPQPVQDSVEVVMPDESIKIIDISMKDANMKLAEQKIVVTSNLEFVPQ